MSNLESLESEPQTARPPSLPPVEPPSPGFIVQLFIVPAIIVVVIVMVWLSFSWLAHLGEDPKTYIDRLKNRDWHAAYNLSQSLSQSQHNKQLVENREYAQAVADALAGELAAGSLEPKAVKFRRFLCLSLGKFHVDNGLPVLLKAVKTNRDPREVPVRCEALEAIMELILNLQQTNPPAKIDETKLLDALIAAAEDDARYLEPADEVNKIPEKLWSVRERAVFALGMLKSDEAIKQLETYLDSSEPNVRYNAAAALAQQGKTTGRTIAVLVEMLDPEAGLAAEKSAEAKAAKRHIILNGALPAIASIVESDTQLDLASLVAPLEHIAAHSDNSEAKLRAKSLLISLRERN